MKTWTKHLTLFIAALLAAPLLAHAGFTLIETVSYTHLTLPTIYSV